MKRNLLQAAPWRRYFHQSTPRTLQAVPSTQAATALTDVTAFRQGAFSSQTPFHMRKTSDVNESGLSAISKWFDKVPNDKTSSEPLTLSPYMNEFMDWPFPIELVSPPSEENPAIVTFRDWLLQSQDITDQILAGIVGPAIEELPARSFFQLYAPLKLLKKALEFNSIRSEQRLTPLLLYIAQSSLADLPPKLQDDIPTPSLVLETGKGDIYNSSIWLGTEPTYTPLHRDPNPNLFYQLCSGKVMRLLPPDVGDRVYFEVQVKIRQQGNSRIRTTEMMEGREREELHQAVWENEKISDHLLEAELGPGDALFVPNGWWHSVKSQGSSGHLNGSVNWWFR